MQRKDINPGAFAIDDVLCAEECTVLIRRAEEHGFELAPTTTAKGFKVVLETRNNERVIFDDVDLANLLWSRVRHVIPEILAGREAIGLNERFRLYRYAPGQRFSWHSDGAFRRENGEPKYEGSRLEKPDNLLKKKVLRGRRRPNPSLQPTGFASLRKRLSSDVRHWEEARGY